jgi:hypothetical protein
MSRVGEALGLEYQAVMFHGANDAADQVLRAEWPWVKRGYDGRLMS